MTVILPENGSVDSVRHIPQQEIPNLNHKRDLTITRTYRNDLGYAVNMIDRNNVVYQIQPQAGHVKHEFVIVETIVFTSNVKINTNLLLDVGRTSAVAENINKSLKEGHSVRVFTDTNQVIIEYVITANQLARQNHRVYFEEVDITIAHPSVDYTVVHPYSPIGQSLIVQHRLNEMGFNYIVVINDPHRVHGTRYINISNRVFKVETTRDSSMKPGVYLYAKGEAVNTEDYGKSIADYFFEFSEADEKVPLFKTASDAKDFGDAHLSRTEEIKKLEAKVKKEEAELKLEKLTLESTINKMKADHEIEKIKLIDELENEKRTRERETATLKHQIEMNSLNRKDLSEFTKWLPGLLVAITALANLYVTMKKNG